MPRGEIIFIDQNIDKENIIKIINKEAHSRMPVVKKDLEHCQGMVHIKDLFKKINHERKNKTKEPQLRKKSGILKNKDFKKKTNLTIFIYFLFQIIISLCMARITVEDCIDKFSSRFELVLVASNRARKLHSGEEPTVERDNDKNSVIALREIAEGTISAEDFKTSLIEEYQTVSLIDEEEDIAIENSNSQNEKEDDSVFKNSDNQ